MNNYIEVRNMGSYYDQPSSDSDEEIDLFDRSRDTRRQLLTGMETTPMRKRLDNSTRGLLLAASLFVLLLLVIVMSKSPHRHEKCTPVNRGHSIGCPVTAINGDRKAGLGRVTFDVTVLPQRVDRELMLNKTVTNDSSAIETKVTTTAGELEDNAKVLDYYMLLDEYSPFALDDRPSLKEARNSAIRLLKAGDAAAAVSQIVKVKANPVMHEALTVENTSSETEKKLSSEEIVRSSGTSNSTGGSEKTIGQIKPSVFELPSLPKYNIMLLLKQILGSLNENYFDETTHKETSPAQPKTTKIPHIENSTTPTSQSVSVSHASVLSGTSDDYKINEVVKGKGQTENQYDPEAFEKAVNASVSQVSRLAIVEIATGNLPGGKPILSNSQREENIYQDHTVSTVINSQRDGATTQALDGSNKNNSQETLLATRTVTVTPSHNSTDKFSNKDNELSKSSNNATEGAVSIKENDRGTETKGKAKENIGPDLKATTQSYSRSVSPNYTKNKKKIASTSDKRAEKKVYLTFENKNSRLLGNTARGTSNVVHSNIHVPDERKVTAGWNKNNKKKVFQKQDKDDSRTSLAKEKSEKSRQLQEINRISLNSNPMDLRNESMNDDRAVSKMKTERESTRSTVVPSNQDDLATVTKDFKSRKNMLNSNAVIHNLIGNKIHKIVNESTKDKFDYHKDNRNNTDLQNMSQVDTKVVQAPENMSRNFSPRKENPEVKQNRSKNSSKKLEELRNKRVNSTRKQRLSSIRRKRDAAGIVASNEALHRIRSGASPYRSDKRKKRITRSIRHHSAAEENDGEREQEYLGSELNGKEEGWDNVEVKYSRSLMNEDDDNWTNEREKDLNSLINEDRQTDTQTGMQIDTQTNTHTGKRNALIDVSRRLISPTKEPRKSKFAQKLAKLDPEDPADKYGTLGRQSGGTFHTEEGASDERNSLKDIAPTIQRSKRFRRDQEISNKHRWSLMTSLNGFETTGLDTAVERAERDLYSNQEPSRYEEEEEEEGKEEEDGEEEEGKEVEEEEKLAEGEKEEESYHGKWSGNRQMGNARWQRLASNDIPNELSMNYGTGDDGYRILEGRGETSDALQERVIRGAVPVTPTRPTNTSKTSSPSTVKHDKQLLLDLLRSAMSEAEMAAERKKVPEFDRVVSELGGEKDSSGNPVRVSVGLSPENKSFIITVVCILISISASVLVFSIVWCLYDLEFLFPRGCPTICYKLKLFRTPDESFSPQQWWMDSLSRRMEKLEHKSRARQQSNVVD